MSSRIDGIHSLDEPCAWVVAACDVEVTRP